MNSCKDKIPYDALYRQFIEAIRLVAAPCDVQITALPSFVHVPDEIALDYDNRYCLLSQFLEHGYIRNDQTKELIEIDGLFARMSGSANAEWWTHESMKNDPLWEKSRQLAREALRKLGEVNEGPIDTGRVV